MPARRINPPFRAEHLGSFIRPGKLVKAREAWRDGQLPLEDLRRIEDECIRDVVAMQERCGLRVISDGEFRKWSWRDLLFDASDGFTQSRTPSDFTFTDFGGTTRKGNPVPDVVGKVKRRDMLAPGFDFVKQLTSNVVKATVPAPSCNHFFRGDRMLAKSPYNDRSEYFADIAAIYRQEIADLAKQGCTYLQIDDVPSAVLCDPRNADIVRQRGEDPEKLIDEYFRLFNESVKDRPKNMTLAVHLCRGNSGHGQASGGYEKVAERLFNDLPADAYFLEYDTERAGGFEPLRHLPKDKVAVLGMISTKLRDIEPEDELRRRIDVAAKHVDLDRLAISPQCGFASNYLETRFTQADEEKKLTHMVAVATKVWGSA
jgi:5-methyltetrahydropteroyltriglutamate--homocysteine methyltransferase